MARDGNMAPPFGASFILWMSAPKCHVLVGVIFDPSNCLENTNKHLETFLHIPMPHQRLEEQQNRAFISFFAPRSDHEYLKNLSLTFSYYFSNSLYPMPQKPVQTNLPTKIFNWCHKKYHFWPLGSGFRFGNGPQTFRNEFSHQITSGGHKEYHFWPREQV